jgi:hypothetical protein
MMVDSIMVRDRQYTVGSAEGVYVFPDRQVSDPHSRIPSRLFISNDLSET